MATADPSTARPRGPDAFDPRDRRDDVARGGSGGESMADGRDLATGDETTEAFVEPGRAERRRSDRDVILDGAPREGVDIIRPVERAIVVSLQLPGTSDAEVDASLDELEALLNTAGGEVVDRVVQRRDAPSAATWIGRGKAEELRALAGAVDADSVVFDDDLAPAQQRNLEEIIRQKVLDRTIVILDIFAQHATSREGKAQVEMAQLSYMLPRLRGWGDALSRQAGGRVAGGGGIGGRGPGETQLEVDRRRINRRIAKLRRDLSDYDRIRSTKAKGREDRRVRTVALVGYTNAGKSSLLNALTGSTVKVRDQLFATLDPTVRSLDMPDGSDVVVTDTVGFVRKLPHGLVEAFTSTLEESADADLLLLVVDASHPEAVGHIAAVHDVLEEIGADGVAAQMVLNKADVADPVELASLARHLAGRNGREPIIVSAHTGEGTTALIEAIQGRLPSQRIDVTAHVPWERGDLVSLVHDRGDVHVEEHGNDGTALVATVDEDVARRLRPYLEDDPFMADVEPWEAAEAVSTGDPADAA